MEKNTVPTVREQFFKEHGPLLTTAQLAKILSRTEEGLRVGLRNNSDFSRQLCDARKRFGRRIYFSTDKVAEIIGLS